MNAKFAAVLLIAAIALPVFATESADYGDISSKKSSTVTRAEVHAEFLRARAAGELRVVEANFPFAITGPASTLNRAEVIAETKHARSAGELDFSDVTYPVLAATPRSMLTRADVCAQVVRARKDGTLDALGSGAEIAMR